MIHLFFVFIGIIHVLGQLGEIRRFAPSNMHHVVPGPYNTNRIWMQISQPCFPQDTDIRAFKDYLLSQYSCITFDNSRPQIYKYEVTTDYSFWSLWFEKRIGFTNTDCLNTAIILPQNVLSSCIDYITYEPLAQTSGLPIDCTDQGAADPLWSLDILDGKFYDSSYDYPYWGDYDMVEVIVLDQDVYKGHSEFSESNPESLDISVIGTENDHGTHVAATIVGKTVGGAKKTKLWYYPVCRTATGSCAYKDIENGYEAAIKHMLENNSKRYVINFSVGGVATDERKRWYDAFGKRIVEARGVWVVSAGNNNIDACDRVPAFSKYALTVGAYDKDTNRVSISNYWASNWGECVDVYGPGVDVYSAAPSDNGYRLMDGTSAATPNIASMVVNILKWYLEFPYYALRDWMSLYARCKNDSELRRKVIRRDDQGNAMYTEVDGKSYLITDWVTFEQGISMIQPYLPFCVKSKGNCPTPPQYQ